MAKNMQSRKYILTVNNPLDHGLDRETLERLLGTLGYTYCCLSEEIGAEGTPHCHAYVYRHSPIRFRTLKKLFPAAHIEVAYGSSAENRDYIRKEGKWADTDKAETRVEGSFAEYGEMPTEREEKSSKMEMVLNAVKSGMSTAQIIEENPELGFRAKDIDIMRQTLLSETHMMQNRELEVVYVYGAPGTGKTRSIYEAHGARNICRVTNYRPGKGVSFDAYTGQDVLVFEEFNNQIPIEEMLNYLDVYPLMMPARYNDRVACYTRVYITSNIPLEYQYTAVQAQRPDTWKAFLRRIHTIVYYTESGVVTMPMEEWRKTHGF